MEDEFIPIIRPTAPPLQEYINEISDIWNHRIFTNTGSKLKELETKIAEYLDVANVSLFANGHLALETALACMNMRGEVITTPFTFVSTVLAIVRNNLTPVFCDINEEDYTINCDVIEGLITERTCAILPIHIYGNVCDVQRLGYISKKYNIPVIYDAAHAFGVRVNDVPIGNYGDISMFSFHATKVFHTVEGGGLVYKDPGLKNFFSQYRNFGIEGYDSVRVGANLKMSEIHAAMGLCNLRYVDEYIEKRCICARRYIDLLSGIKGIFLNEYDLRIKSNYSYFPIRIVEREFGFSRDEVYETLLRNKICSRKYYDPIVSELPLYNGVYDSSETPVAKMIANQILTLPLYPDLNIQDVERICHVIIGMKK